VTDFIEQAIYNYIVTEAQLLDKIDSQEKRVSVGYFVPDKTVGVLKILSDLPKDVAEDAIVEIKVDTYISDDNISWRYYAGFTYIGGKHKNLEGKIPQDPIPPGFRVNAAEVANKYIKTEMTINKIASAGVRVELWQ